MDNDTLPVQQLSETVEICQEKNPWEELRDTVDDVAGALNDVVGCFVEEDEKRKTVVVVTVSGD